MPKALYIELDEVISKRLDDYCASSGRTKRWVVEAGVMQVVDGDSFGYTESADMVSLVMRNGRVWKVPRDFALQYEREMGGRE